MNRITYLQADKIMEALREQPLCANAWVAPTDDQDIVLLCPISALLIHAGVPKEMLVKDHNLNVMAFIHKYTPVLDVEYGLDVHQVLFIVNKLDRFASAVGFAEQLPIHSTPERIRSFVHGLLVGLANE